MTSTGVHRPNPSLFQLPGLRSLPFWTKDNVVAYKDPTVSKIIQHVESNADAIAQEYLAAVMGVNRKNANEILEPDYDLGGSKGNEHGDALHEGQWDWHSYILKVRKSVFFHFRIAILADFHLIKSICYAIFLYPVIFCYPHNTFTGR